MWREENLERYHRKVAGSSLDPCVYCGRTATTIDHIEPTSKGGSRRSLQNWAPMCAGCNNKADKSLLLAFFHPQLKSRITNLRAEARNKLKKAANRAKQAADRAEWLAKQTEHAEFA